MATINANICIRRDTAANWTSNNPTLLTGEMCYETDTGKFKVGTGTVWTSTSYSGGVTAPGLGAITRTVDAKLLDILSVKDYGATGDGSTDDKLAIQAAMNAGGTSNRAVYFPGTAASYKISGVVTVPDGVTVFGDGIDSLIETTNSNANIFSMGHDTTVKELHFKVPTATYSSIVYENQNAIYANGKNNVTIQNNRIQITNASNGILIWGCRNVSIKDNLVFGATWQGGELPGSIFADIVVLVSENTPPTASVESNRFIISGNYCLSNNASGIIGNFYGSNSDILITSNISVALDPATCTVGGTWKEVVSNGSSTGPLRRRNGIDFGYVNDFNKAPRSIISNNICRNTLRTGIYLQAGTLANTPGPVLVTGNMCSLNGQNTDTFDGVEGGILFNNTNPKTVITNNVIYDFKKETQAAINYLFSVTTGVSGPTISNNFISESAGYGIQMVGPVRHTTIKNNHIVNSVKNDILMIVPGGITNIGGLLIEGNVVVRNNFNFSSVLLDHQNGEVPLTVKGNKFLGYDKTSGGSVVATVTEKNAAVTANRPRYTRVINNIVENFHVAYAASGYVPALRNFNIDISNNIIKDCIVGVGISSTAASSTTAICGNSFEGVTKKISNTAGDGAPVATGFPSGYVAQKENDRIVVFDLNAAPTVGTWAVADRVEYTTPTAGGFLGAVCTTAGSPGTWKTFGAISA